MFRHGDGVVTKVHTHGDNSGNITFETVQDVTSIVADAKARHNEGMHGSSEMRHAARLPRVAIDNYCATHNITFGEWLKDKKHVKAMLNDPMLKDFRIWGGRV